MPGDYSILAPIYDTIRLNAYVAQIIPRIMDYAQSRDWAGRRIMVLGCGTGTAVEYLNQYTYMVQGVDSSPDMLEAARGKSSNAGTGIRWIQADIREALNFNTTDLVLALNCLNEVSSLRDLELIFANVKQSLEPGKLFIFDLQTVKGLIETNESGTQLVYDNPKSLMVVSTSEYDFERHSLTNFFRIFQRYGDTWKRTEARQILRGFPIQAVATLLQRSGLKLKTLLSQDLIAYDAGTSDARRVIFIVES
jgi:SAM-dependent methyltransferase